MFHPLLTGWRVADAAARSLRLCVVGDSIATGTGDRQALGWHGRLAARAYANGVDLTIYDLGVRGDTSLDVARRWPGETAARLPELFGSGIIFQFGLNDCTVRTFADGHSERRVRFETSLATTRSILLQALARHPTLFVGPAPIDDSRPGPQLVPGVLQATSNHDIRALGRQLEAVAHDVGVPCLAVFDALDTDERWLRAMRDGDGIHPADEGYDAMAELIARWPAWQALVAAA
ncbi:MAG: GDSL-type esterase/lipase family protein [Candidatus Limnocylindrales bacterium]